jgi:hypothetical protein
MNSPVTLEITRTEDNNSVSFRVAGDLAWLQEMDSFIHYCTGFMLARLGPDNLTAGHRELLAAAEALQQHQPFHGKFVTLQLSQEAV